MRLNKLLQKDYTLSSLYYQIKLPLDVEILIPADDPVRLLSAFVEGMELSDLYQTYRKIKKNQAKLFDKILVLVEECENLYGFRITYNGKVSLPGCRSLSLSVSFYSHPIFFTVPFIGSVYYTRADNISANTPYRSVSRSIAASSARIRCTGLSFRTALYSCSFTM